MWFYPSKQKTPRVISVVPFAGVTILFMSVGVLMKYQESGVVPWWLVGMGASFIGLILYYMAHMPRGKFDIEIAGGQIIQVYRRINIREIEEMLVSEGNEDERVIYFYLNNGGKRKEKILDITFYDQEVVDRLVLRIKNENPGIREKLEI